LKEDLLQSRAEKDEVCMFTSFKLQAFTPPSGFQPTGSIGFEEFFLNKIFYLLPKLLTESPAAAWG
jgi:hypothetical protein